MFCTTHKALAHPGWALAADFIGKHCRYSFICLDDALAHPGWALASLRLQLRVWRCFCAACCAVEAKLAKVAIQDFTGDTFREDVGWIAITLHLEQGEISAS